MADYFDDPAFAEERALREFLLKRVDITPQEQAQQLREVKYGWELVDLVLRKLSNNGNGYKDAHFMKIMIAAELLRSVIGKCPGDPKLARDVVLGELTLVVDSLLAQGTAR